MVIGASRLKEAVSLLASRCREYTESRQLGVAVEDAATRLRDISGRSWTKYVGSVMPRPRFIQPAEPLNVTVGESGEAILPLRLYLDEGYAPATDIELLSEPIPHVHQLGGDTGTPTLSPGQTVGLDYRVTIDGGSMPVTAQLTLRAQVRYRAPDRTVRSSPMQSLSFHLRPAIEEFQAVKNPFIAYAGGTTVNDPEMYFGRKQLTEEIVTQLRTGPLGLCYAVYGQKRTGKSSLLEQVRQQLDDKPTIVATLSFGSIDRQNITSSFARTILEQIRVPLLTELPQREARVLRELWPSSDFVERNPLESLRTAMTGGRRLLSRQDGWASIRYVILMDEFTYLFEVLRRPGVELREIAGVREFMRQWKALLEGQFFSALVLGQDTLPYFTQAFPNEFSNMASRRLSYLTRNESHELARDPVLREDGTSRYMGYALDTLHSYTDGHPFFTQIVCDRLVRQSNDQKRAEYSEHDVIGAVESLLSGPDALEYYKFDCFLTADNTGLITSAQAELASIDAYRYDDQGIASS